MEKGDRNYGRAYAFMDLDASREQIEAELPMARQTAKTPSRLEVSLRDVRELIADRTTDPDLVKCIYQNSPYPIISRKHLGKEQIKGKRMADLKYVIEVKSPKVTTEQAANEEAATEVTNINRYLYNTFGNDKPFYSTVILKAPTGQYCPWEDEGQKYID
jgi:hypothetical protein